MKTKKQPLIPNATKEGLQILSLGIYKILLRNNADLLDSI